VVSARLWLPSPMTRPPPFRHERAELSPIGLVEIRDVVQEDAAIPLAQVLGLLRELRRQEPIDMVGAETGRDAWRGFGVDRVR